MIPTEYAILDDEQLVELLFMVEDRLDLDAALEIAGREAMMPLLGQIVMTKHNWLAELPEWWAVVHASYLLGKHAGADVVQPLLASLRWSDAFDCDWVTEVLPSIFGSIGPASLAGLVSVARDACAGWSARDVAMKSLASIALKDSTQQEHVFRIIGQIFMDEMEDRAVRQLAGRILMDFRCQEFRMALLKFAKEEYNLYAGDAWYVMGFTPEEVELIFKNRQQEIWHYEDDWMRFYQPAEIQRRQKRWVRERLGASKGGRRNNPGGGRVFHLYRGDQEPELGPPEFPNHDPEGKGD